MQNLPLNALRAFAAIYQTGGVRPAARQLSVTHSAVSRYLRELEAWLELPLLEPRTGGGRLVFTVQGEALGRAASESLAGLHQAVSAVRESRRGNAVVLATTASVATRWLLPRIANLGDSAPWIELSVVVDHRLADPGEQGADLGIRMGRGPWRGLRCEPLMDDALYPVMGRASWNDSGRPEDPGSLSRLRLIHDRDPNASWAAWQAAHGPAGLNVRTGPRFASSDLVLRAAVQGVGVALARDRLATEDLESGALVRPFADLRINLPDAYWIVRPKAGADRAAVAAVVDWLKREAQPAASL